jgi:hypothetical protein
VTKTIIFITGFMNKNVFTYTSKNKSGVLWKGLKLPKQSTEMYCIQNKDLDNTLFQLKEVI